MTVPDRRQLTWQVYLDEVLPELLGETELSTLQIGLIIEDIGRRATSYAACSPAARRALRVSFLDDVTSFNPVEAPIGARADVAVVVRNSVLEDEHANGAVRDAILAELTYLGCGAFNVWLNSNRNVEAASGPAGVFAGIAGFPCGFAALQALALAAEAGGRRSFRLPESPKLSLPPLSSETMRTAEGGHIVRSANSEYDNHLLQLLSAVSDGVHTTLITSSLSRYSRDSTKIAQILEHVLAHNATVLTTNLMVRPGEAFARRPPFIAADSSSAAPHPDVRGLSGTHAKTFLAALADAS